MNERKQMDEAHLPMLVSLDGCVKPAGRRGRLLHEGAPEGFAIWVDDGPDFSVYEKMLNETYTNTKGAFA